MRAMFLGEGHVSKQGKHQAGPQLDPAPAPVGPWDRERLWLGPRRLLALMGPALRLVWRASAAETIRLLVLQTLSGVVLPLQVLAGK